MRVPRIYQPQPLAVNQQLNLDEDGAAHIGKVLRMGNGEQISLFNGDGHDYLAEIIDAAKKSVTVKVLSCEANPSESPLNLHLLLP